MQVPYPQPNELRKLVMCLKCIDADKLKFQFLLKQACQNPGNISRCRLAKHLQACCHASLISLISSSSCQMTMRDDANMSHYQAFKETRKMKCLPCYLTPHKWKRESVKTKGRYGFLLATIILSLPAKQCIQNSVIYFHFCTAMKHTIYRTEVWETAQ